MKRHDYTLFTVLCIILVSLAILLIGYMVYTKFIKTDDESKVNEIDILGQELFNKVSLKDSSGNLYLYDDYINYSTISNDKLLSMTLQASLNNNLVQVNDDCYLEGLGLESCYSKKVSKSDFENTYKELFGSDKTINYETFSINKDGCNETCNLNKDYITCINYYTDCTSNTDSINYVKYLKTIKEDDTIYVYANYLMLYVNNLETLTDNIDELFDKYEDELSVYKLTFNKDTSGNYYWIATSLE